MCGIAGAVRTLLGADPVTTLNRMNDVMIHRGPDMGEIYNDEHMGLCHRRLSIIDLSEGGRQPMHSDDGRYIIVFNGEIYNFLDLRRELELEGHAFRSESDTEVLLRAYMVYGAKTLEKINGMFAFAIWDNRDKELFLARDRVGKKPLYYYRHGREFAFASEIKSLKAIPSIDLELDYTAFADYLKYLFIPHPKSIYKEIYKLEPGHYLTLAAGEIKIKEYWDVDFSSTSRQSEAEIAEELLSVVSDAVKCRLVADVPLGAFLSGGIDSSGIVALMSRETQRPVTTCTIGFKDKNFNEATYAKDFAGSLHTDHHEHYVQSEPAEIIRKLVWHCDEPFADSSMVPTYYVSKMARENVTVALSGDGGDENFAGYSKYVIDRFENTVRRLVPRFALQSIASVSGRLPDSSLVKKIHSLSSTAALTPAQGFYITNSFITDDQLAQLVNRDVLQELGGYNPADHLIKYYNKANAEDHLSRILYTDIKLLLPGDFLVKVDRMSMANSLEVRSPLLDYRLIEFVATIPSRLKLNGNSKKYILKKAFEKILPPDVLNRKKHGFESPINDWFRKELRETAKHSFFSNKELSRFFDIEGLKRIWKQHQSGACQHGTLLWTLFVFAVWLEE